MIIVFVVSFVSLGSDCQPFPSWRRGRRFQRVKKKGTPEPMSRNPFSSVCAIDYPYSALGASATGSSTAGASATGASAAASAFLVRLRRVLLAFLALVSFSMFSL